MKIVFLIGAQKAASTYLADLLGSHPQVHLTVPKEPSFYSRVDRSGSDLFNYCQRCRISGSASYVLDASTSYLYTPGVARAIKRDYPDARIILLTRDPVDRAVSAYSHLFKRGHERRGIEDIIEGFESRMIDYSMPREAEISEVFAAQAKGLINVRPYLKYSVPFWPFLYLTNGLYPTHVNAFRNEFDAGNIRVLDKKEFVSDSVGELGKACEWLGLDEIDWSGVIDDFENGFRLKNRTRVPRADPLSRYVARSKYRYIEGRAKTPLDSMVRKCLSKTFFEEAPEIEEGIRIRLREVYGYLGAV